jgi:hypothetical protein
MQTESFKDEVVELALELAWSLWAELSVSGWTRRHSAAAIDLEPLILYTSWLGQFDRRLRDESVDWCISNPRFVSAIRLKNLLRRSSTDVSTSFADFSTTVKSHARVPWPGNGTAWKLEPSGKSGMVDLARPALIQLDLRAICGVSARAEVLRLLISDSNRGWTSSELAQLSAYGKANVTAALDTLVLANLVKEERLSNGFRFSLLSEPQLIALLGGRPAQFPVWSEILRIVEAFVRFATTKASVRSDVRSVEVGGLLREIDRSINALGLTASPRVATGTDLNYHFDAWVIQLMRQWAGVPDPAAGEVAEGNEATYTINRLSVPPGAWMGIVSNPGEQPRALEMPEWAEIYVEHPRSDTIVSDDSVGAPRVAHEILQLAEKRAGRDLGDYWGNGDGMNQLVARAFAEERLWPMRPGQSITFGETFLRAWRRDRLERLAPIATPSASATKPSTR